MIRSALYLAWRYVLFNRGKTAVLVLAVALAIVLPAAISLLLGQYERRLTGRARTTPLVLGAEGNRFDLVLRALYFRPGRIGTVPASLAERVRATDLADAIPLHARYTAADAPVVGTTLGYFDFRDLRVASGRMFGMLGETVVGAALAERLNLQPGDTLESDRDNVYNLAKSFPLRMSVVGVLAPTGTADDFAAFVDVKTAWILDGLGHGHQDLTEAEDGRYVLERDDKNVTASAAVQPYTEITRDNIDSFHFHGDTGTYPISAVIAVPDGDRGRTILASRVNHGQLAPDAPDSYQALRPAEVMDELLSIVLRVKRVFDLSFAVVAVAMLLLLGLIVLLSLRLRRDERETIHRIGGSRSVIFATQAAELAIILITAIVLAAALSAAALAAAPRLFQLLT